MAPARFGGRPAGGCGDLGVLPGHQFSAATGVSDDGTIVVGISSTFVIDRNGAGGQYRFGTTAAISRAFIWREATGMQDLTQLLANAGLNMTGTTILAATGISTDGVSINGVAITPRTGQNQTEGVVFSLGAPAGDSSRLLNLSTRGVAQSGDNVLIPGFFISGAANKRLLIRAVGPTLRDLGFTSAVIPDPQMTLRRFNPAVGAYEDVASNDNVGTNPNAAEITTVSAQVGAFALRNANEAALLRDVAPGQYTVTVGDRSGTRGVGIVEVYDVDSGRPASSLTNISNRGFCGVGDEVMIPGFVVSAESARTLLVRVVGPTLAGAPFNVPGTMADPRLIVFSGQTPIAANDNWGAGPDAANTAAVAQQVGAFPLAAGGRDAALVVTLAPGNYTVVGSSATAGGSGIVLVEVYVVP